MTAKYPSARHVHIAAVSGACLQHLPALLQSWLPDGRVMGGEWVALNPTRADRRAGSFKINMTTGRWADFATNHAGGDLVSLYAYLNGLSQIAAARALIATWGMNA
jgi:hypothetical protein